MANMEPAVIYQQKQISKKKYRHRPCNVITFLNILISLCLFALYCEQRIQIYNLRTALAQVQEEAKKNEVIYLFMCFLIPFLLCKVYKPMQHLFCKRIINQRILINCNPFNSLTLFFFSK